MCIYVYHTYQLGVMSSITMPKYLYDDKCSTLLHFRTMGLGVDYTLIASGPGNSVQTAYTDFDVKAPSWGRSDELHYFRKSCCLFHMLNYSKEP